jgi:hypothetical protein
MIDEAFSPGYLFPARQEDRISTFTRVMALGHPPPP